jgi:hypothetical protein
VAPVGSEPATPTPQRPQGAPNTTRSKCRWPVCACEQN